ncbi:hypothetical protein [Streptomyces canus]|uniref:hypothetical protein n=1 Tax=Streptomyces canus TaxID=58343 RepID=UPI003CEB3B40
MADQVRHGARERVRVLRSHLAGQSEPCSAAEIATALGQPYPGRGIKTTVVRTTLEGLVAKRQAQRTKQGLSVFHTATDAAGATASCRAPRSTRAVRRAAAGEPSVGGRPA